jgi:hypothetical protein
MQRPNDSGLEFSNGDVRVWIDQEAIHLYARDSEHNDPVELTCKEAKLLGEALIGYARRLEQQ